MATSRKERQPARPDKNAGDDWDERWDYLINPDPWDTWLTWADLNEEEEEGDYEDEDD